MSALAISAALAIAQACAPSVAPGTLLAVMQAESGLQATAILDDTTSRSYAPDGTAAAIALATDLVAAGHSIDAGIAQINVRNWSRLGLTAATVFEPCANVAAEARVLVENYHGGDEPEAQQAALRAALAAYNAGPRGGANPRYIGLVEAAALRVIPEIRVAGEQAPELPTSPSPSQPPAPPSCAPSWDGWALAACTAAPASHSVTVGSHQ